MTPEEQAKKIEEIYNEAIKKLEVLGQERANLVSERQGAIRGYIKDLETKKGRRRARLGDRKRQAAFYGHL
jgi:hypothetical protein